MLPNCPQHIVAFYAILRLGAVVVEHNPLYTPRELRKQFEDHGAKHAIVWTKVVKSVQDFPADLAVKGLVSVDIIKAMPFLTRLMIRLPIAKARESRAALYEPVTGTVPWEDVVGTAPLPASHPKPATDDLALIQYTSGTTGTPKGASLTHRNLLSNAAQARAWVPSIVRGDGCVVYAVLPMFHAYGLTLCLTFAMSMGARLVLFPRFDPDMVLDVHKKHPATFLPLVPPIADRLLKVATEKGVSLAGTQVAISGAMALPHELVVPFEKASGGYLVEGYGLSECSPVLMANPVAENRVPGTVGLPIPGTECRVVDPDNPTQDVPAGERGELIVRGPQVFQGYYGKPEETEAVMVDGWFRTGDIVDDRRGRIRPDRRSHQGAHHHGRVQRRPDRGGERAPTASARRGRRGRRPSERALRRGGRRRDRRGSRRGHRRRGGPRVRARDPHALQGAAADLRGRRAAEVAHRQGAAP